MFKTAPVEFKTLNSLRGILLVGLVILAGAFLFGHTAKADYNQSYITETVTAAYDDTYIFHVDLPADATITTISLQLGIHTEDSCGTVPGSTPKNDVKIQMGNGSGTWYDLAVLYFDSFSGGLYNFGSPVGSLTFPIIASSTTGSAIAAAGGYLKISVVPLYYAGGCNGDTDLATFKLDSASTTNAYIGNYTTPYGHENLKPFIVFNLSMPTPPVTPDLPTNLCDGFSWEIFSVDVGYGLCKFFEWVLVPPHGITGLFSNLVAENSNKAPISFYYQIATVINGASTSTTSSLPTISIKTGATSSIPNLDIPLFSTSTLNSVAATGGFVVLRTLASVILYVLFGLGLYELAVFLFRKESTK